MLSVGLQHRLQVVRPRDLPQKIFMFVMELYYPHSRHRSWEELYTMLNFLTRVPRSDSFDNPVSGRDMRVMNIILNVMPTTKDLMERYHKNR